MKRLLIGLLAVTAIFLAAGCDLPPEQEEANFVSLIVNDSLLAYDTLRVIAWEPVTGSPLDTLWNAPVDDPGDLIKLFVRNYDGGDLDMIILGYRDGREEYSVKVEYRGNSVDPKVAAYRWDTLPPVIRLRGPDSTGIRIGESLPDTGCFCTDDRPGRVFISRQGGADNSAAGLYVIEYQCTDPAGNPAVSLRQRIRVQRWPDTVAPILNHPAVDSHAIAYGGTYSDSGIGCADAYDGPFAASKEGTVDAGVPGSYPLVYRCTDLAGNQALPWQRWIRILPPRDSTPPVIVLRGLDSLLLYEGQAYLDSGATCRDVHDGDLPVKVAGSVNPALRGLYTLVYSCADSAGNSAAGVQRRVRVARAPDPDKPMLRLLGRDSLDVFQGLAYVDSGATCLDGRDGALAVVREGAVEVAVRAIYQLRFHCADSAGNAVEAFRKVRVVRAPDVIQPILALRGADSLNVYDNAAYTDSGAVCTDDRDGESPVLGAGSVNTAIRGRYVMVFQCSDSAGNAAAAKQRVVHVVRMPDFLPPVIALKGRDSVQIPEGLAYVDSGATCADDRDGALPVAVVGTINTALRGFQSLAFRCADSAGNAALEKARSVKVIRLPDSVKPVITLLGNAALNHDQDRGYADSGANCNDSRDGALPVTRIGTVDIAVPGLYPLKFACSDSAGNIADTLTRQVTVVAPPDLAKPVLTMSGPDSIPVVGLAWYVEPGVTCIDAKDGAITPVLGGFNPPTGPSSGYYRALYSCTDKAGNTVDTFRVVKAGLYTTNLLAHKDGAMDTLDDGYNMGYNGMLAMSYVSGDKYGSVFQFDFAAIAKSGLKSAKLRFVTWARHTGGSPWPGKRANYTFNAYAVKRQWVEGTGNWFWHNGDWANGGEEWFFDYWLPTWVTATSTNPAEPSGVTGLDRDIMRPQNLTLITRQTTSQLWRGDYPSSMASPPYLEIVEIDVTEYVKKTSPANHFGFFVTQEGAPDRIGILSREVDDGKWAARLMLTY